MEGTQLAPQELRDYLEQIRLLETDRYMLDQLYSQLTSARRSMPQQRIFREPVFNLTKPEPPNGTYKVSAGEVVKDSWWGLFFGGPLALIVTAIGHKQSAKAQKEIDEEKYQKNLQYYEQQVKKHAQSMAQYNQAVANEDARMKRETAAVTRYNDSLRQQQLEIAGRQADTEYALKKLYDLNIIYPSYRGLLPVTRFCEYLDSGLRTKLTGADGMYDLYEQELRSQAITNSMERVREEVSNLKLGVYAMANQIVLNQKKLLESLERNNAYVEKVSGQMTQLARETAASLDRIEQQNEAIRSASEWTAYSAACTERSNRALAELEQMRYVHHID